MRNTLVPMLLLATVALSASNILPILSKPDQQGYSQSNDNIFRNKQQSSNDMTDLLFKIDINDQKPLDTRKSFDDNYSNADNNAADEYNSLKDDIYDAKGFRKEQWHNYPRQLDRLNKYIYEHFSPDKRNLEPDDPGEHSDMERSPENTNDIATNEIYLDDSFDSNKPADGADKAAAIMNPLIILKLHLAYLNKDLDFSRLSDKTPDFEDNELRQNEDYNLSEENPRTNLVKVKREGNTRLDIADSAQHEPRNRMVKKRIFSLWSRLQGLNHRGHELHHRRHLYALYGLPDSEGGGSGSGGVLTAETRATFMRPPGSPLRWG